MTSEGHPYARFRRALNTGNATIALAAARELPTISLADALAVCLLLRPEPRRYQRAILRWHARYLAERPELGADEAIATLALLGALTGNRPAPAARALAQLLDGRDLEPAVGRLLRWAATVETGRGNTPPG